MKWKRILALYPRFVFNNRGLLLGWTAFVFGTAILLWQAHAAAMHEPYLWFGLCFAVLGLALLVGLKFGRRTIVSYAQAEKRLRKGCPPDTLLCKRRSHCTRSGQTMAVRDATR